MTERKRRQMIEAFKIAADVAANQPDRGPLTEAARRAGCTVHELFDTAARCNVQIFGVPDNAAALLEVARLLEDREYRFSEMPS